MRFVVVRAVVVIRWRYNMKLSSLLEGKRDKDRKSMKAMIRDLIGEYELETDVEEVAPPGANYERMVKHLKDKFGSDSPVPYQIAWTKYKNRGKK